MMRFGVGLEEGWGWVVEGCGLGGLAVQGGAEGVQLVRLQLRLCMQGAPDW